MDHKAVFTNRLQSLRDEGRYRVFAELGRQAGKFPRETHYKPDRAVPWGCKRALFVSIR
jgi:5-aminolevulinate synthase